MGQYRRTAGKKHQGESRTTIDFNLLIALASAALPWALIELISRYNLGRTAIQNLIPRAQRGSHQSRLTLRRPLPA